jgi:hypothetical protein
MIEITKNPRSIASDLGFSAYSYSHSIVRFGLRGFTLKTILFTPLTSPTMLWYTLSSLSIFLKLLRL